MKKSMGNLRKRGLGLLLALVMLVGMLPHAVFAVEANPAGTAGYATVEELNAAFEAVGETDDVAAALAALDEYLAVYDRLSDEDKAANVEAVASAQAYRDSLVAAKEVGENGDEDDQDLDSGMNVNPGIQTLAANGETTIYLYKNGTSLGVRKVIQSNELGYYGKTLAWVVQTYFPTYYNANDNYKYRNNTYNNSWSGSSTSKINQEDKFVDINIIEGTSGGGGGSSGGDTTTIKINTVVTVDGSEVLRNSNSYSASAGSGYTSDSYKDLSGFNYDTYNAPSYSKSVRNSGGYFGITASNNSESQTTNQYKNFWTKSGSNEFTIYYTATRKQSVSTSVIINVVHQYYTNGNCDGQKNGTPITIDTTSNGGSHTFQPGYSGDPSYNGNTYTYTSCSPSSFNFSKGQSGTLGTYTVRYERTVEDKATVTIQKVFVDSDGNPMDISGLYDNFEIVYKAHEGSQNGDVLVTSALTLSNVDEVDEDTATATWKITYDKPGTDVYLELSESGYDITGYTCAPTSSNGAFTKNADVYTVFVKLSSVFVTGTRTITNTYTPTPPMPTTASYKVEWYDTDGNGLKAPETRTGTVGTTVSATDNDKSVTGYIYLPDQSTSSAALAASGTELKLYFVKSITVTWLKEDGTQIKQETIPEGADYTELYPDDPSDTGEWGDPETDDDGNITIRWEEPGTPEAKTKIIPVTLRIAFDRWSSKDKTPTQADVPTDYVLHYSYTDRDGDHSGDLTYAAAVKGLSEGNRPYPTLSWEPLSVKVAEGDPDVEITIWEKNYLIGNNDEFIWKIFRGGDKTVSGKDGPAKLIQVASNLVSREMMMTNEYGQPPEYTVTVKYVDENGNAIDGYPDVTVNTIDGGKYDVNDKKIAIAGYTYQSADKALEGTVTENTTITLTYKKNTAPVIPNEPDDPDPVYYTLTINYVDEEGNVVATQYRESLESGTRYSVTSPAVEGMTPDRTVVSGRLNRNTAVTVVYSPDEEIEDPDTPLIEKPEDPEPPKETEEPGEEDLGDMDTPLAEIPDEELEDPELPLAETPDEELEDPEPPLAQVPQTGDSLWLWILLTLCSAAGLFCFFPRKKGKRAA